MNSKTELRINIHLQHAPADTMRRPEHDPSMRPTNMVSMLFFRFLLGNVKFSFHCEKPVSAFSFGNGFGFSLPCAFRRLRKYSRAFEKLIDTNVQEAVDFEVHPKPQPTRIYEAPAKAVPPIMAPEKTRRAYEL